MKKLVSVLVALACFFMIAGAVEPNQNGNVPLPPMSMSEPTA